MIVFQIYKQKILYLLNLYWCMNKHHFIIQLSDIFPQLMQKTLNFLLKHISYIEMVNS